MKIIRSNLDLEFGDNDDTVIRSMPEDSDDQETMVLPHPDETLILERSDPLYEGIPASNVYCTRAASLLSLVPKLRMQPVHENIKALHVQLVEEIKAFETIDSESGLLKRENKIASHFICALLDETILNTPWGRKSKWENHSMLKRFHGEGQEGRKFYVLLKQLLQSPDKFIQLIELAYICMSLGYEGIYGKTDMAARTVGQHRQKLFDLIQKIKGPDEAVLSTNWEGIKGGRRSLKPLIPLWVSVVVVSVVLMVIYFGVIFYINQDSDRVARRIDKIAQKETVLPSNSQTTTVPVILPPAPTITKKDLDEKAAVDGSKTSKKSETNEKSRTIFGVEKLNQLLDEEIKEKKITVLNGPTVRIANAFQSGSDAVKDEFVPILHKLGKFLSDYDVRVLVVGHTDNQPMFSGRFPSNWHLSEARAKSAATRLAVNDVMAEQVRFEGHGASEPITDNDTAQNRALNRRLEIHIR